MPTPLLLQQVGEMALALAIFAGGGIVLMAVAGVTWGVVEDWRRERRWNRG